MLLSGLVPEAESDGLTTARFLPPESPENRLFMEPPVATCKSLPADVTGTIALHSVVCTVEWAVATSPKYLSKFP
jgi:hypothetical protein